MSRLSRIVLILRDVSHAVRFYRDGLGLHVEVHTDTFARLRPNHGPPLELNAADSYVPTNQPTYPSLHLHPRSLPLERFFYFFLK